MSAKKTTTWFANEEDAGYGFSMSQQGTAEIAVVYYYEGTLTVINSTVSGNSAT